MINIVYRLISPKLFEEAYDEIDVNKDVVVRPTFLSICKADQRYYFMERGIENSRPQTVLCRRVESCRGSCQCYGQKGKICLSLCSDWYF